MNDTMVMARLAVIEAMLEASLKRQGYIAAIVGTGLETRPRVRRLLMESMGESLEELENRIKQIEKETLTKMGGKNDGK